MKIQYNVTGAQRKSLVGAIRQELNTPAKYLGAPTFAYKVGHYHIDKNGMLTGEDNPDLIADLQGLHNFKAVTEEYDAPVPDAEPVPYDVQIPYEAALGGRVSPYRDFEEPPAYEVAERNEPDRPVIEMPADGFTNEAFDNLQKLVASKSSLIKKAIGAETLAIERLENTLKFPWFTLTPDCSEKAKAYTHLVTALCDMAKRQKRVNASEKPVVNEKYAFRCFLLRLGFIGAEYKGERKILLSRLTGSSAFKTPAKGGSDDE